MIKCEKDLTFPIKVVARMCGVSEHTLRAWEKRYGVVAPLRSGHGDRLYSNVEVERLKVLSRLNRSGYKMKDVAELPTSSLLAIMEEDKRFDPFHGIGKGKTFDEIQKECFEHLKSFHLDWISECLHSYRLQLTVPDFVINLVVPLLGRLGGLVDQGLINVSQEHALSAIVRDQVAQVQVFTTPAEKSVALTTPDGNFHEFGILLAATLCRCYGMEVHYFGASLPPRSLGEAVNQLKVDYIMIGNTGMPSHLKPMELSDYFKSLSDTVITSKKVWYGGVRETVGDFEFLEVEYVSDFVELGRIIGSLSRGS